MLNTFLVQLAKGNWDYNEMNVDICQARKTYEVGRDGLLIRFKRPDLAIQAQI